MVGAAGFTEVARVVGFAAGAGKVTDGAFSGAFEFAAAGKAASPAFDDEFCLCCLLVGAHVSTCALSTFFSASTKA